MKHERVFAIILGIGFLFAAGLILAPAASARDLGKAIAGVQAQAQAQEPPAKPGAPPQGRAGQAAQQAQQGQQGQPGQQVPATAWPERPFAVTKHTITIGGKPVAYTATAGWMTIDKPDEKPGARMYFTAYTADGVRETAARPLTFVFNGGPGSSSVWLHLGGLGPRRVVMNDEGVASPPPYGLEDSPNSLLDVTDMVYIDPVMTGYSRPLAGENKTQFTGVGEDVASVGAFIRTYVTRFERWASPKYILGESYGTTRAAGLSGFLQGRTTGMFLNGIILVSSVLDFSTLNFLPGSSISYIVYLPHYTATAWYHKKLAPELQARPLREVLAEAEKFAAGEYAAALFQGNRLTKEEGGRIAERLAAFTGLGADYVKQANLRVMHPRFVKELLRGEMKTVGRLDSRFTGHDMDAAGEAAESDPSSDAIMGAFSTMLNNYLRTELKVKEDDLPYAIYGNVYPWNFLSSPEEAEMMPGMPRRMSFGAMNVYVAGTLERAMRENPGLRVFVANGFYDGATPYFGTQYTFAQIGLQGELAGRVKWGFYEAGHMMYIHKPSLVRLKSDLAAFIAGSGHGK